jgi:hypothetical protein
LTVLDGTASAVKETPVGKLAAVSEKVVRERP